MLHMYNTLERLLIIGYCSYWITC